VIRDSTFTHRVLTLCHGWKRLAFSIINVQQVNDTSVHHSTPSSRHGQTKTSGGMATQLHPYQSPVLSIPPTFGIYIADDPVDFHQNLLQMKTNRDWSRENFSVVLTQYQCVEGLQNCQHSIKLCFAVLHWCVTEINNKLFFKHQSVAYNNVQYMWCRRLSGRLVVACVLAA